METYHLLIIIGIVLLVVEIFTITFFFASVSIGIFLAALANYLDFTIENQIYIFSVGVIVTFFAIRPLFNKIAYNSDKKKTNRDDMIGRIGIVTKIVGGEDAPGLVKLNGDIWKAISKNKDPIDENTRVEIEDIDSIVLIVKQVN
jgi:membrane protein implicated in regulation of membrane protease activity